MKLFSGITAYRFFSSKSSNWSQNGSKNKIRNRSDKLTRPRKPKIEWTDQQLQVLDAVNSGKSVFVTGSAGTGKTILVKQIIKLLKKIHGPSRVFVTASTGVAACAIRGQTLHSFAGIGLGEGDRETLLRRVLEDKKAYWRWNKVMALIIDECSMVDPDIFEKLEYIAGEVRDEKYSSKNSVWGGIQLVVSGDFFQLPPILDKRKSKGKEFAFEADCWNRSFDVQVELTRIFRQSGAELIKLLQGIRRGEMDPDDLRVIEQRCSEIEPDASVVQLYPRSEDVKRVNKKQLESLGEDVIVYRALDWGEDPWKKQLKHGIAPDELELCVGARVMLTKNINPWRKLVNGATGTVIDFYEPDDVDDVDVTEICDRGVLPVVKFDSGSELVIDPDTWTVMEGEKIVASREQIPLILAWALSIHKCQGMTLDRLHTNLSRSFGCGMVYVALSRIISLDGLHLSQFSPSKVKAHPKVLKFYQSFTNEQTEDEDNMKKIEDIDQLDVPKLITCRGPKSDNYLFQFLYAPKKASRATKSENNLKFSTDPVK